VVEKIPYANPFMQVLTKQKPKISAYRTQKPALTRVTGHVASMEELSTIWTANGCPVLRRQDPSAEGQDCAGKILISYGESSSQQWDDNGRDAPPWSEVVDWTQSPDWTFPKRLPWPSQGRP
jgi:hypothetical protein